MTFAWTGGGMSKGEAKRFRKDVRKGLEKTAREAYRAQLRAIDEQLAESRKAAKVLLEQQKAACSADFDVVKAKADEAFRIATELARQERDAERDAKKRSCTLEASSVRELVKQKAQVEAAKRNANRDLAADLRTIRRKDRKDVDARQVADEDRRAHEQHATRITELDRELTRLSVLGRHSLAEQRAACNQEYEAIKAKAGEACAESVRLAREQRRAQKDTKRKQCSLEAASIRDAKREEANALRAKKDAERAFKSEMKQIEASTRARDKERKRATPKERASEQDDAIVSELEHAHPRLVPLWRKVRRSIRGNDRKSRLEAFLQYAEENPSEVHAEEDRELARDLRAHERAQQQAARRESTARMTLTQRGSRRSSRQSPPADVPF